MKSTTRPELSFDGWGINGSDEYRTRIATFRNGAEKYGPLFAAAPDLLSALKELVAHVETCREAWEESGSDRNTKLHGLAVCLNNRAGDNIKSAIAKASAK